MTGTHRLPAHREAGVTVYLGDAREVLTSLPAASIDCCVTSPPYWGLRDYDLEPQVWGPDPACAHRWEGGFCLACAAWRGHLGLEPSPELYTRHVVEVFRAVRRVLKPGGTLWLNLGDCYNSGTTVPRVPSGAGRHGYWQAGGSMGDRRVRAPGLKTKDLVGIPWRVALALQADGWYLRAAVVWAKSNPMPESVRDRPIRAHEYVFLLTRSPRYFYDAEAIRERRPDHGLGGRSRSTIWTIATQPYRGAHFATFPERLVEPCILAGTSHAGCCPRCGEPWLRRLEIAYANPGSRRTNGPRSRERRRETPGFLLRLERRAVATTWEPGCACDEESAPAVVLDPFAGSGTTAAVAANLGRNAIAVELSPRFVEMIRLRCSATALRQRVKAV